MPTAYMFYNAVTAKEDRVPLGSGPSALAAPYGIGRGLVLTSSFIYAGGHNAINPSRKAAIFHQLFLS